MTQSLCICMYKVSDMSESLKKELYALVKESISEEVARIGMQFLRKEIARD